MQITDLNFWIGLVAGAVLGFGGGLCLFLPIVWRQTALEDALDNRKAELRRLTQTIERIRERLDDMIVKRDRELFDILGQDNGISSRYETARRFKK
jgi:hypothetical protein